MDIFEPYGPKMCEEVCQLRVDCSHPIFDEVKLACKLVFNLSGVNLTYNQSNEVDLELCTVAVNHPKPREAKVELQKARVCPSGLVKRFHHACEQGKLFKVRRFLSQGLVGLVNCRGEEGRTAVIAAVMTLDENIAMVTLLRQKGADFKITNDYNDTIMHEACLGSDVKMVKYILSLQIIDIESKGQFGRTPLMLAVVQGTIRIVKLLKQKGADCKTKDDYNFNILHAACTGGSVRMVKYVLSLNINDIESRSWCGLTPLMLALINSHMAVVRLLRHKGADIKATDDKNNTVLHVTCRAGNVTMVKYILSLNINDIECKGQFGKTPLMFAVENGNKPVVKFLRQKGANFKTKDYRSNTVLHVACVSGDVKMVNYVLSLKISDIEGRGWYGKTPMMVAVEYGHMPVVRLLRHRVADIETRDDNNNTLLHLASLSGDVRMVRYILSLKTFDIDCRGHYGRTPLMIAVEYGHVPVFRQLQQHRANLTVSDDLGFNLLHVACLGGQLDVVKYLVTLEELRGFERKKDKKGDTPIHVAELKGSCDIAFYLKSRL